MNWNFEHIVIGAGISGLGAAHMAVGRGIDTLVLERGERVGGCMYSYAFAEQGGFWTEAGSHTCFNSYGNLLGILEDLGLMERITPKQKVSYKLWSGGERRTVFSALHWFQAARSIPRLLMIRKDGKSVAEFYGRVLGADNYRDLLSHAFQAVICQPADDYPAEALFRRKPRRKEVTRAFTMPNGLSEIPAAIAAQDGLEVRTGQEIAAVLRDGDGFRLRLTDGSELGCAYLTLAVPPDAAAGLVPGDLPEVARTVASIGMAEIETLLLVFGAADLDLPPVAGLIAVDDAFYSAVSRDFMPDSRYRGFAFHFRPQGLGLDSKVERACRALGVPADSVCAVAQAAHRLPALRKGHMALVDGLDQRLNGVCLGLTGNWFLGVSIEDCLTRSRSEMLRLFGEV